MRTSARVFKQYAAAAAVELVRSGMVVGLGTGTTAIWAVRRIGELIASNVLHDITGIPTSLATAEEARKLNIPLGTLEDLTEVDMTIDGADEIDPRLNLIKGAGGALLREKLVAQASRRVVIVADESKLSEQLGARKPLPVEVVPFGWTHQQRFLEKLGARVGLRTDLSGQAFLTDQGNYVLDCRFGPIADLHGLERHLNDRCGIVEHGLFQTMATDVILAGPRGVWRHVADSTVLAGHYSTKEKLS
jgi:ribose 5-phosphate isomerase A